MHNHKKINPTLEESGNENDFVNPTHTIDITGISSPPNMKCWKLSQRFAVAWMVSIGLFITFGIRCNLGVAYIYFFYSSDGLNKNDILEFQFDPSTVELRETAFLLGYLASLVSFGIFAAKTRAHLIFGTSIAVASGINLLVPVATALGPLFSILRFCQGAAVGAIWPSLMGVLRWWAPPLEKSRFVTIAIFGAHCGGVVGLMLSNYLSESLSWSIPFYLYGGIGLLWCPVWLKTISDKPSSHPRIKPDELAYIEKSIGQENEEVTSVPWRKIFSSPPVWAIVVAHVWKSWMQCVLTIAMPSYLGYILRRDFSEIDILPLIPRVILAFIIPITGIIADLLLRKRIMNSTRLRKTFNSVGMGLETLFVFGVALVRFNEVLGLTFFMLASISSGITISGYFVNHLEVAPRFASVLIGLSESIAMIFKIMFLPVKHAFVPSDTMENWEIFFWVCGGVHIIGAVIYGVFASGEVQTWAKSYILPESTNGLQMSPDQGRHQTSEATSSLKHPNYDDAGLKIA